MKYFIALLISLSSIYISAQHKRIKKEKIKALKIAYLTEKLNLTSNEAEKFWPAYNKYDETTNNLRFEERHKLMRQIKKAGNVEGLSEADASKIVNRLEEINVEIYKNEKEFYKKLKNVLSSKKIIQLKIAELEFHKKLFQRYKKQRRDNRKKERS